MSKKVITYISVAKSGGRWKAQTCSLKTKQCKVEIKPDVRTNITSVINVNQNNFDFLKSLSRFFINNFYGEFDPGSGRTLAACLTHASRTDWCLTPSIFAKSARQRICWGRWWTIVNHLEQHYAFKKCLTPIESKNHRCWTSVSGERVSNA